MTSQRSRLLALLIAGCGDSAEPKAVLTTFVDTNADPNIVEVELVAAPATHDYLPGKPADVWAFRDGARAGASGSIPGPMLEASNFRDTSRTFDTAPM
jgi:hypothetical protein